MPWGLPSGQAPCCSYRIADRFHPPNSPIFQADQSAAFTNIPQIASVRKLPGVFCRATSISLLADTFRSTEFVHFVHWLPGMNAFFPDDVEDLSRHCSTTAPLSCRHTPSQLRPV
jgi:hypothetical protein